MSRKLSEGRVACASNPHHIEVIERERPIAIVILLLSHDQLIVVRYFRL
jgi:hypothetical protein